MNRQNYPFALVVIGCSAIFMLWLASPQVSAQVSQQQQVTELVNELKSSDHAVVQKAADAFTTLHFICVRLCVYIMGLNSLEMVK